MDKIKTARDIVKEIRKTHGVSDFDRSYQSIHFEDTHEMYNALLDFIDEYDLTETFEEFLSCNLIEDNK
jgi:hypothetical protein